MNNREMTMAYDVRQDATAGGAIALAISGVIAAHGATTRGAPQEVLQDAQKQLAWVLNEYIINRIAA